MTSQRPAEPGSGPSSRQLDKSSPIVVRDNPVRARSGGVLGWRAIALIFIAAALFVLQATLFRSPGSVTLDAVSSGSVGSGWAVGSSCSSFGATSANYRTVILRRHGALWSQVSSPSPGRESVLRGVSAWSSGAWAVGSSCSQNCDTTGEVDHTFILQWNKTAWSIRPS
jgi:hypothetical protein